MLAFNAISCVRLPNNTLFPASKAIFVRDMSMAIG